MARSASSIPNGRERLRVITAGEVGNVHAPLGSSGFDVVAVVDSEAELVIAVGASDPDAIVVEANLCDSLEHIHELAPDAALIVIGDHTPAGALGHIDRGVTGTALAGLLQALARGGATAAMAVPGFTSLAVTTGAASPRPTRLTHTARQALTGGAVGIVVVATVAAALVWGESPSRERASRVPSAPAPVAPTTVPSPPPVVPGEVAPPGERSPQESPPTTEPAGQQPVDQAPSRPSSSPSAVSKALPAGGSSQSRWESPPRVVTTALRPAGRAYGWELKPSKHEDNGHHYGWTRGNGPKH